LVEDRVVRVHSEVILGEGPGATISFPGKTLRLTRSDSRVFLNRVQLVENEVHEIEVGPVMVTCERIAQRWVPPVLGRGADLAFPVLLLSVMCGCAWVAEVQELWDANPDVSQEVVKAVTGLWTDSSDEVQGEEEALIEKPVEPDTRPFVHFKPNPESLEK